ncbi:hypothetical protein CKAH01_14542 [Colletotrichum kahawae]|uniref:Uncharacterized protein n=1 Tax=Colletotrichum kahawae TaxID=34407 RepID=A0AAD9YPF1_COLKA|nr:hypothetical protein CKAH01_14542 [Colletotrichum kahawae]
MASAGHQQPYRSHSSASSGSFNGARSPHLGNDDGDDDAAAADSGITVADLKANWRQIQELTRCVSSTLDERGCDAAFREYAKVKEHAELCRSLLRRQQRRTSSSEDRAVVDPRSPLSRRNLALSWNVEPDDDDEHSEAAPSREACLAAIRDWKACMEAVMNALRASLAATYRSHEPGATPAMTESLFRDVDFRASAIQEMRRARIDGVAGAAGGFSRAKYDVRFRNLDRMEKEAIEIARVLQSGEAGCGFDDGRAGDVEEVVISAAGDAVLEFNSGEEVRRFRVSSAMLAETSPIFERMFTGRRTLEVGPGGGDDNGDLEGELPPLPPTEGFVCGDGSVARLYRMPQAERDEEGALGILLQAAHMRNDAVPREVSFARFVAVAEVCLRYRCTSPLELVVEHRWLPRWIHMGSEEMPDGMLVISFVFGFRQLFARMSKTAVLNLRSEEEMRAKRWPERVKERVWGVREVKMGQVEGVCREALREYLRGPGEGGGGGGEESGGLKGGVDGDEERDSAVLKGRTRCPRGSQACDAMNLGWLMLVFGELGLLGTVMKEGVLGDAKRPDRSLAELVGLLRTIESPPQAIHRGGLCDPASRLRAAVSDVYNSVSGLTLFEVSGRAHGWGLSRHRAGEVQAVLQRGLTVAGEVKRPEALRRVEEDREAEEARGPSGVTDDVRLRILSRMESVDDLHAAALADRAFYRVFKENEGLLMRRFVKAHRRKTLMKLTSMDVIGRGEQKAIKGEGDLLKMEREAEAEAEAARVVDGRARERDGVDDLVLGFGGLGMVDEADELVRGVEVLGVRVDEMEKVRRAAVSAPPFPSAPPFHQRSLTCGDLTTERMSDEEVQRILWPDDPLPVAIRPSVKDMKEKFRRSDPAFVEEKMLLGVEGKQLGIDRDRRVGLVRDGG